MVQKTNFNLVTLVINKNNQLFIGLCIKEMIKR